MSGWDDDEPVHPYVPETESSKANKRIVLTVAIAAVVLLIALIIWLAS